MGTRDREGGSIASLISQISRELAGGGIEDNPGKGQVHHGTPSSEMGAGTRSYGAPGAGLGKEQMAFPTDLTVLYWNLPGSVLPFLVPYISSEIGASLCSGESLKARYPRRSGVLLTGKWRGSSPCSAGSSSPLLSLELGPWPLELGPWGR